MCPEAFSVSRPILFIHCTADPISGHAMRRRPLIPQARFKWLPGSNHVPISDDPETVVSYLLEFLEQP